METKSWKSLALLVAAATVSSISISPVANAKDSEYSQPTKTIEAKHFSSLHANDPKISKIWNETRLLMSKRNPFLGPWRLDPRLPSRQVPNANISARDSLDNVSECKLPMSVSSNVLRGFVTPGQERFDYWQTKLHPGPDTVYQIVGLQAPDAAARPGQTPSKDYGHFLQFLSDWTSYISDYGSTAEFRVLDKYLTIEKRLKPLKIKHGPAGPGHEVLAREIEKVIGDSIDFSDVDLVIFLVPSGTDASVIQQSSISVKLTGKNIHMATFMSPAISKSNANSMTEPWFSTPMGWLHELHHVGYNYEDSHGDSEFTGFTHQRKTTGHLGTGDWGTLAGSFTDLLGWQKWLGGFWQDEQIRCVSSQGTTTHWLSPATVKTKNEKLLVIPLSQTEVLVVESQRAAGLNYKIPKSAEGALVYYINIAETRPNYGYKVLLAKNEKINTKPFLLSNAPINPGQYLTFRGIEIRSIEAGLFGDVIAVTRP